VRHSAPAAPRQVVGELGDRIVAAVTAAGDLLGDQGPDRTLDRKRFIARVKRASRAAAESDVLEVLADVALAPPAPAARAERPRLRARRASDIIATEERPGKAAPDRQKRPHTGRSTTSRRGQADDR
jgi:hypothetical protein